MNTAGSRESRRISEGTGVYIALFLVVTALAVAGYWTLVPHSTIDTPAVEEPPASAASLPQTAAAAAAPLQEPPEPPTQTFPSSAAMAEDDTEPVAPVHKPLNIELPAEEEQPVAEDDLYEPEPAPGTLPGPVVSPVVGETAAVFSMEELAYSETMGDWRTHDGIDIAAAPGAPVCAACVGTVIDVRDDDLMGATVVISHAGGYDTLYSNLQELPAVSVGDDVVAGQIIGAVGETALSETSQPSHLHFGVTKDGEFIDPLEFLD